MAFDIAKELKKLPTSPGVYMMFDAKGEVLYVGKAIRLRNRVRQYFQSPRGKSATIRRMVERVDHFEVIVTGSELEALVLENNLIKEHHPRYNTLLKDDKTYPYIKVTLGEPFPRVILTRSVKKDASRYFGPYTSGLSVRRTIELTRKKFGIRACDKKLPAAKPQRPCLYYEIGACPAPCAGYISEEEYSTHVDALLAFLSGDTRETIRDLAAKMEQASAALDFEYAGELRDLIAAIEDATERQKITSSDLGDRDVIALAADGEDAIAQVFFVRDGKLIGREHFYLQVGEDDDEGAVLSHFIAQYYAGTPHIPKELMLEAHVPDEALLAAWLSDKRGHKVSILVPQRGMKEKLVEMAKENAALILSKDRERVKREESRTVEAARGIARLLGIASADRMEAYDISNTGGYDSVGSMIVFEHGRPKKSDYRKFRIRSVIGPDDYASMREVLTRRFERAKDGAKGFDILPDLVLMDGGKGQVHIAEEVLSSLHLSIPVCGMVKDDAHNTRGLYYQDEELPMDLRGEEFHLITRIQDEAHRFAITYHKALRSKGQIHSVLDDIRGIGPARRKALLRAFGSIEQIADADVEALEKVHPMSHESAVMVYNYFHQNSNDAGEDHHE